MTTDNEEIPYEYQVLSVLRRFDRITEENQRLRAIIKDSKPLIEQLNAQKKENKRLQARLDEQEAILAKYREKISNMNKERAKLEKKITEHKNTIRQLKIQNAHLTDLLDDKY